MDNGQGMQAGGDDNDADELVFRIHATDLDLLSVQTSKQRPEEEWGPLRGLDGSSQPKWHDPHARANLSVQYSPNHIVLTKPRSVPSEI